MLQWHSFLFHTYHFLSFKKANSHHGRPCKLDLQQNSTISFYSSSPNRKKSIQHFLLSLSGYCPNSFWKQSSVQSVSQKARTGRTLSLPSNLLAQMQRTMPWKLFKIQYHVWYFECSEDEQNETRLLNVSLSPTAIFSIHLFKAAGTSPWLFQRNSPVSGEVCWVTSAKAGQPPRFCRMSHHWPEAGRYQPVVVAGTGQVVL